MEGICARLGNHTDRAAAVPSVFSRIVIFQETELRDVFWIRIEDNLIAGHPIVDAAVEQIRDRVSASPRNADTIEAVRSPVAGAVSSQVVGNRNHTGLRQTQIQRISSV